MYVRMFYCWISDFFLGLYFVFVLFCSPASVSAQLTLSHHPGPYPIILPVYCPGVSSTQSTVSPSHPVWAAISTLPPSERGWPWRGMQVAMLEEEISKSGLFWTWSGDFLLILACCLYLRSSLERQETKGEKLAAKLPWWLCGTVYAVILVNQEGGVPVKVRIRIRSHYNCIQLGELICFLCLSREPFWITSCPIQSKAVGCWMAMMSFTANSPGKM